MLGHIWPAPVTTSTPPVSPPYGRPVSLPGGFYQAFRDFSFGEDGNGVLQPPFPPLITDESSISPRPSLSPATFRADAPASQRSSPTRARFGPLPGETSPRKARVSASPRPKVATMTPINAKPFPSVMMPRFERRASDSNALSHPYGQSQDRVKRPRSSLGGRSTDRYDAVRAALETLQLFISQNQNQQQRQEDQYGASSPGLLPSVPSDALKTRTSDGPLSARGVVGSVSEDAICTSATVDFEHPPHRTSPLASRSMGVATSNDIYSKDQRVAQDEQLRAVQDVLSRIQALQSEEAKKFEQAYSQDRGFEQAYSPDRGHADASEALQLQFSF